MVFNLLFTLLLVFLNGFFVAAEFALVKVRISQLELQTRSGNRLAGITKNMVKHLDAYLSATQLGITLASLGLGWIGEPVVVTMLIDLSQFLGFNLTFQLAHSIALPVAFLLITMLHIIFGELAPKSLAIQRSEKVALAVAIPLRMFYLVFSPLIILLNYFANLTLKFMGFGPVTESEGLHSSDELRYLLEEGTRSGAIEKTEHKLLENIFEFSETPIKQIMVPRRMIVGIEVSLPNSEVFRKCTEEGYSRLPVYKSSIDNITGIIYAKDLIKILKSTEKTFQDIIRPPYFVQEDDMIDKIMRNMQKNHVHIAIVLDEFGGTAGLVTMEDIIEEIVGDIQDEYDEETPIVEKTGESEFLVKSSASIDDANEYLPIKLEESEEYETVGGLITSLVGRIPELYEIIQIPGYDCQIMKRSKRHIEQVKLILKEEDEA